MSYIKLAAKHTYVSTTTSITINNQCYTLIELNSNTNYSISVAAVNKAGIGEVAIVYTTALSKLHS